MRRVLLAIVLTIGAVAPAGRAALASPASPLLTLTGTRTSYVDVEFDAAFSLDEESTKIDSGGRFGGWAIHSLARRAGDDDWAIAGAYLVEDVGPTAPKYGPHLFTLNIGDVTFPPGRYRVYLLADGATAVRVRFSEGGASKALRPRAVTAARWTAADVPLTAPGAVNGDLSQPLQVNRDSLTISSLYLFAEEGATVQSVTTCLRDRRAEVVSIQQECEGGGWAGYVVHAQQDYVFNLNTVYRPGSVETGKYFAFAKVRATKVERAIGVGVSIDLRGV
jgi:hypothetical protein